MAKKFIWRITCSCGEIVGEGKLHGATADQLTTEKDNCSKCQVKKAVHVYHHGSGEEGKARFMGRNGRRPGRPKKDQEKAEKEPIPDGEPCVSDW